MLSSVLNQVQLTLQKTKLIVAGKHLSGCLLVRPAVVNIGIQLPCQFDLSLNDNAHQVLQLEHIGLDIILRLNILGVEVLELDFSHKNIIFGCQSFALKPFYVLKLLLCIFNAPAGELQYLLAEQDGDRKS